MRDIKMSDVFNLPLTCSKDVLKSEADGYCEVFQSDDELLFDEYSFNGGGNGAVMVCRAINSHDRLLEENEKLKAVLLYAQKECTYNEPSLSVLQRMIDEAQLTLGNKHERY